MNETAYKNKRAEMMKKCEEFINSNQVKEANDVMAEIKVLDEQWEDAQKAQANLAALQTNHSVANFSNVANGIVTPDGFSIVGEQNISPVVRELQELSEDQNYINAWVKDIQGKAMTPEEQNIFDEVSDKFSNEFIHDTSNTSTLIPKTVGAGIIDLIGDAYPLFAEVYSMSVPGKFSMIKHNAIKSGDADWYDEDTETADEENEYGTVDLGGCELSKAVTITWKLKKMAIKDFIPHLQREIASRIGAAKGNAVFSGKGKPGSGDTFKEQPLGVETALLTQSGTPQVVKYTDTITYKDVTGTRSKIHSTYGASAKWYASSDVIWNQLANILDEMGNPIFVPDPTLGGVGRMLGNIVVEDAGASAGNVLLGNPNRGYVWNVNEPMSIVTEDHAKKRNTDYVAYSIEDGGPLDESAFALLTKAGAPGGA